MYNKEELLQINNDYERALKLVSIIFQDKKDKEGEPYINHLIRVSKKLKNPNTRVAGLLHDTIEDIEYMSFNSLTELKFNDEIIELIRLITKDPSLNYHDQITKIIVSNNIEAIKLKYADMSDNYDLERLKKLSPEQQEYFHHKYGPEIIRLKEILEERGTINDWY